MKRVSLVFAALLLLLLLSSSFLLKDEKAEAQSTPPANVLLIVTDDQRDQGTMGVMDHTRKIFANSGTRYENGMVTTPQCCPSRSTIFTGQYIHNHGVRSNSLTDNFNHNHTFQRMLDTNGYYTGLYGKYLNGYPKNQPLPYFDRSWVAPARGAGDVEASKSDYEVTERALDFLQTNENTNDSRPWALTLTYRSPHHPFNPSPRFADAPVPAYDQTPAQRDGVRFQTKNPQLQKIELRDHTEQDRRNQLRMLMDVDYNIDRIWDKLQVQDETRNTLVIFLSDNGYYWGDYTLSGKYLPYLQSMQVPFYARYPGVIPTGSSQEIVANIDIAPTIIEAAGLEPDYPVDGRSLISGESRDWLLLEGADESNKEGLPSWKEGYYDGNRYYFQWNNGFDEYYNLIKDPYQITNLLNDGNASNNPDLTQIQSDLLQARTCAAETCP